MRKGKIYGDSNKILIKQSRYYRPHTTMGNLQTSLQNIYLYLNQFIIYNNFYICNIGIKYLFNSKYNKNEHKKINGCCWLLHVRQHAMCKCTKG